MHINSVSFQRHGNELLYCLSFRMAQDSDIISVRCTVRSRQVLQRYVQLIIVEAVQFAL